MDMFVGINIFLLWLAITFNLLLSLAILRRLNNSLNTQQTKLPEMLPVGTNTPNYQLETIDGKLTKSQHFAGKEYVLIFLSPYCPACSEQIPRLKQLIPASKAANIEMVLVSLGPVVETKEYFSAYEFESSVYIAPPATNNMNQDFKYPLTPSYYFIDKTGKIKACGLFDSSWSELTSSWSSLS